MASASHGSLVLSPTQRRILLIAKQCHQIFYPYPSDQQILSDWVNNLASSLQPNILLDLTFNWVTPLPVEAFSSVDPNSLHSDQMVIIGNSDLSFVEEEIFGASFFVVDELGFDGVEHIS